MTDYINKLTDVRALLLYIRAREILFQTEMEIEHKKILLELHDLEVNCSSINTKSAPGGIFEQLRENKWKLREIDKTRGDYFGVVVAADQYGCFIKYSESNVVELEFHDLEPNQEKPQLRDAVRLTYHNSKLSITISHRCR